MPEKLLVRRAAVLGAGVMGAQIAAHLTNAGVDTVLFDLPAKEGDPNGIVNRAIAGLGKLSKLLDDHAGDLGSFLTKDPRGRRVPDYVRSLSAELEREREALARELDNVSKSIEHVKRIVGAQQRYASGSGLVERCVLAEVVRDASRMSCASDIDTLTLFRTLPMLCSTPVAMSAIPASRASFCRSSSSSLMLLNMTL